MLIDTTSGEFDATYLSLGAGVQSTALYVLATLGLENVPRPGVAIFADTKDEPAWVYDQVEVLKAFAEEHDGPEIRVVSKGKLSESVTDRQKEGKRFVSVPLYTAGIDGSKEGMLRRQCTREYKIEPIEKEVRTWLGYKPRQHVKERVRVMMGITIDEVSRMRPSRTKWITNTYPLVDAGMDRQACIQVVEDAGLPTPKKSSCVYCPYHSDEMWKDLKENHPEEFEKAVEFDRKIRDMTMRGRNQPAFVHRSCQPLDEVDFEAHPGQGDLFGEECEGMCGI